MKRRCVAVVGCGFSGATLAAHLAVRGGVAPNVVLIERNASFGPGLAYGTKDKAHLLNVRASNLSVYPERPDHFVRWLKGKSGAGQVHTRFAPRAQYGAYLEQVLRQAPRLFGPRVTRLRGSVERCTPAGEGWVLSLKSGRSVSAVAVVLALGNPPPAAPSVFSDAGVPLLDPWDPKALRRIPRGDVLVLGAGLTAVDVALSLSRSRRKGLIYMLSRRGQLPHSHLQNAVPAPPKAMDLPLALSEALLALRKDVEAGAAQGEPWQFVVDRLRARTPELWQRLPIASQQRFLRHLRPWWDSHRHRMAPEIAAQIAKLREEGRLRVIAGEIVYAEQGARTIHVQHRQRGSFVRHHLEVAGVVNCTGAAMDFSTSDDPLLRQLFDDGLVRAHPSGIGVDVDAEGRVRAANGAAHDSLYAIGPITQGVFWESTAVPEIRVRAAALATMLAADG